MKSNFGLWPVVTLARRGSPSCVVRSSLRQPDTADLLRSTPAGSLEGEKSEKIILNPPGKMGQNPPYICFLKLKPPLNMESKPFTHSRYIRHKIYTPYGVYKDVMGHNKTLQIKWIAIIQIG